MNVLDTIEKFGKFDQQLQRTGLQSFMGKVELAGGLDALEELQSVPNQ